MFRAIIFSSSGALDCVLHVELIGIVNKPLLLRLVGCLYYLCNLVLRFTKITFN